MTAKTKAKNTTEADATELAADTPADTGPAPEDDAPPDEVDLDAMDEAPEGYAPGGGETASFEETAPPGDEPGNDAVQTMRLNTEAEQAAIERNQRRYDLRTSGLSSAEVNKIEEDERAAARS